MSNLPGPSADRIAEAAAPPVAPGEERTQGGAETASASAETIAAVEAGHAIEAREALDTSNEPGGMQDDRDPLPAALPGLAGDAEDGAGLPAWTGDHAPPWVPPFPPPPAIIPPPVQIVASPQVAVPLVIGPIAPSSSQVDAGPVGRFRRVQLRTSVTLLLFSLGIVAGALSLRLATPAATGPTDTFPSLPRSVAEPLPASAIAQNLERNDVHGLAQLVDGDTLTAIQTQLSPLVSIDKLTFVGSTLLGTDTVAGYVVRGRDQSGNLGIVGLVVRVRNGQVVAQ